MYKLLFISVLCAMSMPAISQYDGAAGTSGSLAIYKNNPAIRHWATSCTSQRGHQDVNRLNLGFVGSGTDAGALGHAGDGQVLSLGDGGVATLGFDVAIRDEDGPDFVVFENAFSDTFLELAFVEVSSDGEHFFRFSAVSLTDTSAQVGTFGAVNPVDLYNLAGKYRANYGVGFDLAELAGVADSTLDLQNVRFVRVIDVVGALEGNLISRDSRGQKINDPYPTAFDTGGFDLDGVGVIHSQPITSVDGPLGLAGRLCSSNLLGREGGQQVQICLPFGESQLYAYIWTDGAGRRLALGEAYASERLDIVAPVFEAAGVYYLAVWAGDKRQTIKFVVNN